jgi:hypothetical protein
MPEIFHEREARDLGDGASHFHARGARADHDEGHGRLARHGIFRLLGDLEGHEHPAANLERVVQALEARREFFPLFVAEVGVTRAGGDHEVIVIHLSIRSDHLLRRGINPLRLGENDFDIALPAKDVP